MAAGIALGSPPVVLTMPTASRVSVQRQMTCATDSPSDEREQPVSAPVAPMPGPRVGVPLGGLFEQQRQLSKTLERAAAPGRCVQQAARLPMAEAVFEQQRRLSKTLERASAGARALSRWLAARNATRHRPVQARGGPTRRRPHPARRRPSRRRARSPGRRTGTDGGTDDVGELGAEGERLHSASVSRGSYRRSDLRRRAGA